MAIREVGSVCVMYGADYLRKSVKPPVPPHLGESPLPAGDDHNGGCPLCSVHRHTAEAKGLVDGMAEHVTDTGEIPDGAGGTIPVARDCIDQARGELVTVAQNFPQLRPQIERADRELIAARDSLAGQQTAKTVQLAAVRVRDAWTACYELALDGFASMRQPPSDHDRLIHWIEDVRGSKMTTEEAVARLKAEVLT